MREREWCGERIEERKSVMVYYRKKYAGEREKEKDSVCRFAEVRERSKWDRDMVSVSVCNVTVKEWHIVCGCTYWRKRVLGERERSFS